jgi:signal transduction histidine kinase
MSVTTLGPARLAATRPAAGRRAAVVGGGLALAALCGAWQGLPLSDMATLVAIAFGVALAVGLTGYVALEALGPQRAPLRAQAVAVGLVSVVGTALGVWAAARAMFVSAHDFAALLTVLVAAATVGVLGAIELGGRVERASEALGELTRRIGAGGEAGADAPAPATAQLASAEMAALAASLEDMRTRLAEARQREQALEGARRELVAWVSHDLRTPLAGIRAMSEALTDGVVTDPDEVARYHATIGDETERLARLVDDLFELSRIQADAVSLSLDGGSLTDVVSDALASARPVAEARGVRLGGRMGPLPPPVELASAEMGRVLQNLLDNAIRHTPAGGAVTVEVGGDADHASITVADECGGIPDDDLDRVFDLAYRGDTARSPGDRGAGLGLAIARGLVEAHAGDIAVRNHDGGCCFTVRLPLAPPA